MSLETSFHHHDHDRDHQDCDQHLQVYIPPSSFVKLEIANTAGDSLKKVYQLIIVILSIVEILS